MKSFVVKIALLLGIMGASLGVAGAFNAQPVAAIDLFDRVCQGAAKDQAVACSGTGKDTLSGTDGVILRAANIMALIAGICAVFMLMLGGFFFVTAGGDSGKVSSAKKTITYAIIGLVVTVLARSIIVFIVTRL